MSPTTTIDGSACASRQDACADAPAISRSLTEPAAFDDVFERHHEVVFRYVASRLGPAAAEDVVGDVFLAAFASRARFDASISDSALPWLLGIATRLISRQRTLQRRWITQCQAAATAAGRGVAGQDDEDRAASRVDASRVWPKLDVALRSLAPREREPLLLHVIAGLSYAEVGAALGLKDGTVRSRISRGRARLASILEGGVR